MIKHSITKLLLFLLIPSFVTAPSPKSAALKDLAASVLIHIKMEKTDASFEYIECSGTFIGSNTILTAAHCFDGNTPYIWARGPYEKVGYPVHLVAWDKKADLALLDAPFGHPYAKIGGVPDRGDYVLNIGSPYDFEFVQSEGKVGMTEYVMRGFTSHYLITTAMANPGSSGGGAFNDHGELIGVNTMIIGMFGWTGLTMTVNTDSIYLFLGQALRNYKHYGG